MNDYQNFIAMSRYARGIEYAGRRETWDETCSRYTNYWKDKGLLTNMQANTRRKMIVDLEVVSSVRAFMTAGPALERDNAAGFNCTYAAVDHIRAFDEAFSLLMCGAGYGFSVERQHIAKLPEVPEDMVPCDTVIVVADSKQGWAT